MRKILTLIGLILALAATMSVLWLLYGRPLSLMVDRFQTIKVNSTPVRLLRYEGTGNGGVLVLNDLHLNLAPTSSQIAPPDIGTTKDHQCALSFGGKVFAFGPVGPPSEGADETLATIPQAGDDASLVVRHSALSWIEFPNFNWLAGQSPKWRRSIYYCLVWKKVSGSKLEMLWRYQQQLDPTKGWTGGVASREDSTALIRIEVQL
jgi:hypothetical protein